MTIGSDMYTRLLDMGTNILSMERNLRNAETLQGKNDRLSERYLTCAITDEMEIKTQAECIRIQYPQILKNQALLLDTFMSAVNLHDVNYTESDDMMMRERGRRQLAHIKALYYLIEDKPRAKEVWNTRVRGYHVSYRWE